MRHRLTIVATILRTARTPQKKSWIVQKTNLRQNGYNWIKTLIEKGLLSKDGKFLELTEKGSAFLRHYRAMENMLNGEIMHV